MPLFLVSIFALLLPSSSSSSIAAHIVMAELLEAAYTWLTKVEHEMVEEIQVVDVYDSSELGHFAAVEISCDALSTISKMDLPKQQHPRSSPGPGLGLVLVSLICCLLIFLSSGLLGPSKNRVVGATTAHLK